MCAIHTVEHNSALKETLAQATTGMNLKDMMLSEVSQTQRANTIYFHLHVVVRIIQFIATESSMVVTGGWREGMGSQCLMGIELQFCKTVRTLEPLAKQY